VHTWHCCCCPCTEVLLHADVSTLACARACLDYLALQGENPHSDLLPHLMSKKGPSGFSSATTAEQVAADWNGAGKVNSTFSLLIWDQTAIQRI
jgi:hypothetical protein